MLFICAAILIFTFIIVDYTYLSPLSHYNQGEEAFASGDYSNAEKHYSAAGNFRDAAEKQALSISIQHYTNAENAFSSEDYQEAIRGYAFSGGYLDANAKINIAHYAAGEKHLADQRYVEAAQEFHSAADYNNSYQRILEIGMVLLDKELYLDAKTVFLLLPDETGTAYVDYAEGMGYLDCGSYDLALRKFESASKANIAEIPAKINACKLLEAEDFWKEGYLASAQKIYSELPRDFSYDGISVSSRIDLLNKYSSFVNICGKWRATGDCIATVRQVSKDYDDWHEWTSTFSDPSDYLTIICIINDDGTVTISGTAEYCRHTRYSSLSAYLNLQNKWTKFSKTVSSVPNNMSIEDHVVLTYSGGKFGLSYSYTDKSVSMYFDYVYKTNYTYGTREEVY